MEADVGAIEDTGGKNDDEIEINEVYVIKVPMEEVSIEIVQTMRGSRQLAEEHRH